MEYLKKIRDLIIAVNENNKNQSLSVPDLLMVVTGGAMAYQRDDGVLVVLVSCLKD